MHIPDSVLSPVTCAVAGVAMTPVWSLAARRVRHSLGTRQMPLLALGAAFCFTIMMFNIPALGGTTAHPVAGTLLAVMLGPWAACIGISVALLIQALFFGDGGLLAYGANCFTMAFVLPFVGYAVYRFLAGANGGNSIKTPACAAMGAYIGINAAAAVVAILLGIQPSLFHEPNGHALYFPFGLHITLPAMLGTHLLVAGPAEAIVTALVVRYLQTANITLYGSRATNSLDPTQDPNTHAGYPPGAAPGPEIQPLPSGVQRREILWIGLLALVALTPLGLLAKGDAWGEWDAKAIAGHTEQQFGAGKGYTPKALESTEAHGYQGIPALRDYASGGGKNRIGYIGAGLLGVALITGIILGGGRFLLRRTSEDDRTPPSTGSGGAPSEEARGAGDLPDWLRTDPDTTAPPNTNARSNPFVERTLGEFSAAAAAGLQSDRWAREPGILQALDARGKVVTILLLIVLTTVSRRPVVLAGLYALGLALGLASRLPLGLLLRRVWLSVPLFVAAIALPALMNGVTPGRDLFTLWHHPHIAITEPGALLAGTLTLRVGVAVTFALLLTWTTRWNELLQALEALFVPRLFLNILAMTYRYLAVSLQTAAEIFIARRSRTVGAVSNRDGRQFVGLSIGALFGKSLAMADEVHSAMLSRGFRGEMRTLARWRWRPADTVWTLAILAAVVAVWTQG
jgi:cobalt/nickel transport system permease protein